MKISIVTSLYNSQDYIYKFYNQYLLILNERNIDYEFVFVDDGSVDNSVLFAKEICKVDNKVKLIVLSRNFGQHNAINAGLNYSNYDNVYVCDIDLEDKVENFIHMINEFEFDKDLDVVFSVYKERKGGFIRGWLGGVFYKIFSNLTDQKIYKNQSWQRLMRREYVQSLLKFNEYESYTAGLMYLTGFNQKYIIEDRNYKGTTSYNFLKRFNQALNAIISFSSKPLIFISLFGFLISFISFIFIIYFFFQKINNVDYETGWSSLILSIWFVGGIIMLSIGIVGLYISKIFNQVKNRPKFIIKKIING